MAITAKQIAVNLDTNEKNCVLASNLQQGTADTTLIVQLLRNGTPLVISDTAEITLVCLYGVVSLDENGLAIYTNGNYVLQPTDVGYSITIADGKATIPMTELITNSAGKNLLILKVVDGVTTYSYSMIYNVDYNNAYAPQSTPNNLPTYQAFKTQLDTLQTTVGTLVTDLDALELIVADKAEKTLANVDLFSAVPDGSVLYKKDGKLTSFGMIVNDTEQIIVSPYSIQVPPNTLHLGDNVSLKENGGFVENQTQSLLKKYLMLDYENDDNLGTSKPIYWARGAKQSLVALQPIFNVIMQNVTSINLGFSTFDYQAQAIYLRLVNPVTGFKFKVNVNGRDVGYYPSKQAWNDNAMAGYNLGANLQKIDLEPFFSALTSYNMILYVKADQPIDLLGDGTLPYYARDLNSITRLNVALEKDVLKIYQNFSNETEIIVPFDRDDVASIEVWELISDTASEKQYRNVTAGLEIVDYYDKNSQEKTVIIRSNLPITGKLVIVRGN